MVIDDFRQQEYAPLRKLRSQHRKRKKNFHLCQKQQLDNNLLQSLETFLSTTIFVCKTVFIPTKNL